MPRGAQRKRGDGKGSGLLLKGFTIHKKYDMKI
jgi:hypothetical protein